MANPSALTMSECFLFFLVFLFFLSSFFFSPCEQEHVIRRPVTFSANQGTALQLRVNRPSTTRPSFAHDAPSLFLSLPPSLSL
ncbi:hypothetical protein ANANG_G00300100, partial [Anguilla anguilla]